MNATFYETATSAKTSEQRLAVAKGLGAFLFHGRSVTQDAKDAFACAIKSVTYNPKLAAALARVNVTEDSSTFSDRLAELSEAVYSRRTHAERMQALVALGAHIVKDDQKADYWKLVAVFNCALVAPKVRNALIGSPPPSTSS